MAHWMRGPSVCLWCEELVGFMRNRELSWWLWGLSAVVCVIPVGYMNLEIHWKIFFFLLQYIQNDNGIQMAIMERDKAING